MTIHRYAFTTWDVVDALAGPGNNGASRLDTAERGRWAGCTLAEARHFVEHGWESGVAEVETRDPRSTILPYVPDFEYSLAEEGSEPDVGAFLAGEPACMGDFRRVPVPKQLVRIGVDLSVSKGVDAGRMLRVGRSILLVVERLRGMGYPTTVDCCFATMKGGDLCDVRLTVQESDQPVHAGLLAFFVAHPGSLRRAFFALCETLPSDVRTKFGFHRREGYGMPRIGFAQSDYDEWAPSAMNSPETIDAWVAEALDRRTR